MGRLLLRAMLALLPGIILASCASPRSFDRSADGSLQYLDQRSASEKDDARASIVRTLNHASALYLLQVGDEFEFFFSVKRHSTSRRYQILAGDKIRIDVLNDAQAGSEVLVRPDGQISVPLIGAVVAAGKTTNALTRELEQRYAGVLTNAQITVNLTEIHSPQDDLIRTISSTDRPRAIIDKVLPDGTIGLPLLQPIEARGRSLDQVQQAIEAAYKTLGIDVSVSLVARSLHSGVVMVLGEVVKPGPVLLDTPHTVLMTIGKAGGVLIGGSMENVRVFYIANDGQPHLRAINLSEELEGLRLEDDMIVPSNSIVYVPTTQLAKTGRLLDQILRDVLRFQGFSVGGTYLINNPSGGSSGTVVVPSR